MVYSKTLRLWLAARPGQTEESTPPPVAVAPTAAPAAPAPAHRKTGNEDAFSDAIMAWMRQGDRLSETRGGTPSESLVLDDDSAAKRRSAASRAQLRSKRIRQGVAIAAAAAGAWIAIAWASRPHVIEVGDRSAYAATAAGANASPAATSVRTVRLDAPGAYLAPQAPPAKPATTAPAAAKPALMAVEVPTAAPSANTKSRRKGTPSKRHGRSRH